MYLNTFAQGLTPVDMTATEEFASLLSSAADLGVPAPSEVRYVSRNVVVNGLRFHLLEWGDPTAPALVVLHGGNQTAHSWDMANLVISGHFHVYAVDQRGHGDTEWPRDGERSRHAMADDVFRLIEGERLDAPIVMGHSMGGIVTMTLVAEHPGIARKVVLVDVGPAPTGNAAESIINFVRSAREFDSVEDFVQRVTAYDPFRSRQHIERTVRYNLMRRADGKFISKHDSRRWDGTAPVASIVGPSFEDGVRSRGLHSSPVLLVRGGLSHIVSEEAGEAFVQALPDARLVTVPNCGHNVHSQNTPGFLEAVLPFLLEP
ncbi:MAG: alpha/beta hydrolase [Dehalococcoidia bacterium]|nr:alpha/beta hydrolase [Dehalococcoidia bacterium]